MTGPAVTLPLKPHMRAEEQVALLRSRGMIIVDESVALRALESIGYYRLSGYWYPYRLPPAAPGAARSDDFQPGLAFETVLRLYDFDRQLKLLVLEAIERVEVLIRVQVAHQLAQHGVLAYRDPACFDGRFTASKPEGSGHDRWLRKLDEAQERSSEDFIKHHNDNYGGQLPVWVAAELLDFGGVSWLYQGMRRRDQEAVSRQIGLIGARGNVTLGNWLHALTYVRNLCAHHARLWNTNMTRQLSPRGLKAVYGLEHLETGPAGQLKRIFGPLCVLAHLLVGLDESTDWTARVAQLIAQQVPACGRRTTEMGCPSDWQTLSLWRS